MYRRKTRDVDARWWDPKTGLEGLEALAEWCGGSVTRHKDHMNKYSNSNYWLFSVPGHASFIPSGDMVILKFEEGLFDLISKVEFENDYERI